MLARADARNRFEVADASAVVPPDAPDVVFNEVLYYLPDPEAVVRRWLGAMCPGGALIVSVYDEAKTRWLWRVLARHADTVEIGALRNDEGTRWRAGWFSRRCAAAAGPGRFARDGRGG